MAGSHSLFDEVLRGLTILGKTQYDGMSWGDTIPLGFEIRSSTQLVRHCHHLLMRARPVDEFYEVFIALMSAGMERTLRVAVGLSRLKDRAGWRPHPDATGHQIADLNRSLIKIVEKSPASTPEVLAAVERVRGDQVLQAMLDLAQSYAQGGRFRYLDELVKSKNALSPGEGSLGGWILVLIAVEEQHVELDILREDDDLDEAHKLIAASFRSWVGAISLFGRAGALSRRGKQFGEALRPEILFADDT